MGRMIDMRQSWLRMCDLCIGCDAKIAYDKSKGCPQFMAMGSYLRAKRRRKAHSYEEFLMIENCQSVLKQTTMKARLKSTGEMIEVEWDNTYHEWREKKTGCYLSNYTLEIYNTSPTDTTDWSAYRREVAKECAAHLLRTNNPE